MMLSVVGFTHKGTLRKQNQDRVLVHNQVITDERFEMEIMQPSHFFVADGVGGMPAGDVAANFVLTRMNDFLSPQVHPGRDQLCNLFHTINRELHEFSQLNPEYEGMATTLAGVLIQEQQYQIISAGDSQVYLCRLSKLNKLTSEPVFGEMGGNNPITSYFGGNISSLNITVSGFDQLSQGDVFFVATDGIFKALTVSQIEKILSNSKSLKEKSDFVFYKAMQMGSPDNISCIFIHIN